MSGKLGILISDPIGRQNREWRKETATQAADRGAGVKAESNIGSYLSHDSTSPQHQVLCQTVMHLALQHLHAERLAHFIGKEGSRFKNFNNNGIRPIPIAFKLLFQ